MKSKSVEKRAIPAKLVLLSQIAALLCVAAFLVLFKSQHKGQSEQAFAQPSAVIQSQAGATAGVVKTALNDGERKLVHAASLVALEGAASPTADELAAFWFAGSREGGRDVVIAGSYAKQQTWGAAEAVITPALAQERLQRRIRKLGNVVPIYWAEDELALVFVTVSAGGWAGSAINYAYSNDGGKSFAFVKRLVTSPAANLSTLVKGAPVKLANGHVLLPVYHEFMGKFSEVIELNKQGEILQKTRLAHGRGSLQPSMTVLDEQHVIAYSRYAHSERPRMAWFSESFDAGRSWHKAFKSSMPNPNSALAVLKVGDIYLFAGNTNEQERDQLALYYSYDAVQWRPLIELENQSATRGQFVPTLEFRQQLEADLSFIEDVGKRQRLVDNALANKCRAKGCEFQFDYPYMIKQGSTVHLVYTWNKSVVMHYALSEAWLQSKVAEQESGQ